MPEQCRGIAARIDWYRSESARADAGLEAEPVARRRTWRIWRR